MDKTQDFAGRVIAITGAGSGIGRALALELSGRGAKVALLDKDAQGLAETCRQLGSAHHASLAGDVTEPELLSRFAQTAIAAFGQVDGVVNNAGITTIAPFVDMPEADFDRIMAVNFDAVVRGTRVFLPHVLARRDGWIVNISSVFGMMACPTQSAYNASKFAVKGLTEALRLELEISNPGTTVVCVHPGGVKTNVARSAKFIKGMDPADDGALGQERFEQLARTTPGEAARTIADGMAARRNRVLIGADARMIDWVVRLFPVRYFRILDRFMI